ncbi:oligosaccharide flippase family protein [Arthrobacter sp. PAMC25564]|uniref:oligosaccharide flippase family protein n=1 Tax=Arthrobacter sp. PAMC25564 TaxID=2565366 RepID=UPI001446BB58|nr:oligosaccharide flippase family protein [Arthrobacter sp. PAMC25564]
MSLDIRLLRKNVFALLAGQVSKLAIQAAYFVVLARMLGATGYGAFAAAVALAALVSPYSSLGTNTLMIKNVARDSLDASPEWKRALLYTTSGGLLFSILLALFSAQIAPQGVSSLAILQIALADLVGLRLVDLVGSVWQSLGRHRALAILPSLANLLRLIAALLMWLVASQSSLDTWATVYLLATLPLGIFVVIQTTVKLGYFKGSARISLDELKEGFLYSTALASQNIYNDIDKAMLGRLISATSAGVYSAAYRIIDMAYAPIRSVSAAAYPLYFREGQDGLRSALRLTRKISPMVLGYAVVGSIGVALVAPLAPLILGSDYVEAVDFVRLMAWLIILRALTFLAADALTGSGHQRYRTFVQVAVAVLNVFLNLYLIPSYGILGAVISTLACEAILGILLWCYIGVGMKLKRTSGGRRAKRGKRGRRRETVHS